MKFLTRSKTTDKLNAMRLQQEKDKLNGLLQKKIENLHESSALRAKKAVRILDKQFVQS